MDRVSSLAAGYAWRRDYYVTKVTFRRADHSLPSTNHAIRRIPKRKKKKSRLFFWTAACGADAFCFCPALRPGPAHHTRAADAGAQTRQMTGAVVDW